MNRLINYFGSAIFFLCVVCFPFEAFAQPVFNVSTTIAPCDDYATKVLGNPWDMSDTADINNFTTNDVVDLSSTSFSSGLFNFTNAQAASGHFYLVSPQVDSLQPVGGRWGQNFPIDTSKYKNLTVRMNLAVNDPLNYGIRVLWHRGKLGESSAERTVTSLATLTTRAGWRNYSLDLSGLSSFDSSSTNAHTWTSSAIQGLGLYPLVSTGAGQIDYIRLEDPASCGSTNVTYTSGTSGNNDLISFYLDDDSDPSNGFYKKISNAVTAASGDTISLTALGMMPGSYKLLARFDSDYATLERNNAWDMNDDSDISSTGGITSKTFSGGSFNGTTTDTSPNIFFDIPSSNPIDASKYNKLSIKLTRSVNPADPPLLFWTKADSSNGFLYLDQPTYDGDSDGVYQVNLGAIGSWSGLIDSMRLQVTTASAAGSTFSLHFLQIRKTGLVTTDSQGSLLASAGSLTISDPPRVQVLQPDIKGGELFKAWDLRTGDVGISVNADSADDSSNAGESLTAYLPDVRSIEGVRGNIYKVTNTAGNGDPNDYMNFPAAGNNRYTINADEYQNLCVKMKLNREYSLTLGSVTKHFYKQANQDFQAADAWATIFDRWSSGKWYEYCLDAKNHPTESNQITWSGTLEAFRVDPHEFSYDNCCDGSGNPFGNPIQATTYYDYIRLAKRDRSYGKFTLAYQTQDSDTATPTVSWAYSTSKDFTSSTSISSGDLSCDGRVCIWNTAAVADGEYYLRATVSDGSNSNTNVSSGTVVVKNGQGSTEVAPVLYVENPTSGRVICSDMQVKGFAVNNSIDEPVVAVQVFFDGAFNQLVVPSEYSPLSNSNYPSRLSDSGFNFTIPISGLSLGAHTVTIKAYSSNGGVASQDISVTRQSACSDTVVSDTAPSGSPLPGAGPAVTPTPVPPSAPNLSKASHAGNGVLQVVVTGISQSVSGCTLNILSGTTPNTLSSLKGFAIGSKDVKKKKITLKAAGVKANLKKLKKFELGVRYTCSGVPGTVASKAVKLKAAGSIAAIGALNKKLKSALKKG